MKNPIFVKDSKALSRDVNSVIRSQEINVDGVESIKAGKSKSELTIRLINPENLSTDSSINNIALEHVAILIKQALRDTGEYMRYTVVFVNRTKTGDVTRTTSTGRTFKSEEIKPYFYSFTLGDRFDSLTFEAAGKSIFSRRDSEVVSSLTYYDHSTNLSGQLKLYKQTDSGAILLTTRDLGTLDSGYNYSVYKFSVSDFYKTPHLGPGRYSIEYMIRDSTAGIQDFKLL